MPGSKTSYLSKALLDHALGGTPWTPPANVWIVLSSAAFTPYATGDSCNELTVADYARLELANSSATWTEASDGAPSNKQNNNVLAWVPATADWPDEPLSIYIADAANGGNLLYGSDFSSPLPVAEGDTFKVLANTFIISED